MRLDLVDQAEGDGLQNVLASSTSTIMVLAPRQQQVRILTSTTLSICLNTAETG